MEINLKLLDKCSELTDYEKDLIRRIDLGHEIQRDVARSYGKTPSTISLQHKKASAKYSAWVQSRDKQDLTRKEEVLDKQAFELFDKGWDPAKVVVKLGNTQRVFELWKMYRGVQDDDYLMARRKLAESGFELNKSSKHPLSELIGRIIREHYWLSEEKRLVWKVIMDKGYGIYTLGLSKYDYDSTPKAVQIVIERLTKKMQ